MADRYLGRRLLTAARVHRWERELERAIGDVLDRRLARAIENLPMAVTAPITAALAFDADTWDDDVAEHIEPVLSRILREMRDASLAHIDFTPTQLQRAIGIIDLRGQLGTFLRLVRSIGPDVAARVNETLAQGVGRGEGIDKLTVRLRDEFGIAKRSGERISRTETMRASNATAHATGEVVNAEMPLVKTWLATSDDRTRDDHVDADGQAVSFDEPFVVGGEECAYPLDPNLSAEQAINCRCTIVFDVAEDATLTDEQQAELDDAQAEADSASE